MRPGTPGWVGARLREAREARGLNGTALADLLLVGSASITQYEQGKQTPSPETLARMSDVLNLPPTFFTTAIEPDRTGSAVFYRSMASATATARNRGERRLRWLQSIVAYLREFLAMPAVNFPVADARPDLEFYSDTELENFANTARQFWGLGTAPISDVMLLLENSGAIITRGALGAETLDAFSRWMWDDDTPYIYLGTEKASAARARFNLAHEIAHLLLHRGIPRSVLGRREMHKEMEDQAHRFASAFLMPAESFPAEVYAPTLEALRYLKPRWNVSIAAMIKRLFDLEIITDEQYRRLRIAYSKRQWNRVEPLDREVEPERPRLLRRCIELLVDRKVQSKAQIRARLPFGKRDIEELACLTPGYLDDALPDVKVLTLDPTRRRNQEPAHSEIDARVIQFPARRMFGDD